MYAQVHAGETQLVVTGEVVHQGSLNWAAPSSPSTARLRLDYQPLAIAVGTLGAASPTAPRVPSARGAEPSPALPHCEGVLGRLQGLPGADCKRELLGGFLPGFSAKAGAIPS